MAPDPGLLRAAKEGGKSQTQLRWVSRVHDLSRGGWADLGVTQHLGSLLCGRCRDLGLVATI